MTLSADCIFCKIIAGEIPSNKVYEDDNMLVFHDINPAAKVHLICIPKAHYANLGELCASDSGLAGKYIAKMTEIGKKEGIGGEYKIIFNTGESVGQTVFHTHGHILSGERVAGALV